MSEPSRPWVPERADYDDLYDVVRHRQMVYRYSDEPVTDDDVEKILEAARWAPSGHNTQPWEFIVLRDSDARDRVIDVLRDQREWVRLVDGRFPAHGRVYLQEAPVLIALAGDVRYRSYFPNVDAFGPHESEVTNGIYYESIGCCMQTIHLAAKALGLGTVHVTVRHRDQAALRDALDLPDHFLVHDVVPVGVPAEDSPGQDTDRVPLEEKLHRERYDRSKTLTDEAFKAELDDQSARVERMHGSGSD